MTVANLSYKLKQGLAVCPLSLTEKRGSKSTPGIGFTSTFSVGSFLKKQLYHTLNHKNFHLPIQFKPVTSSYLHLFNLSLQEKLFLPEADIVFLGKTFQEQIHTVFLYVGYNRSKETCSQCSRETLSKKYDIAFFFIVATFTACIGIQNLQNAHNTNIPNSETAQMRHCSKAICARVF